MSHIFEERLESLSPKNAIEQENIIKEMIQQCVLVSLAREGFFSEAIFHGGTCLKMFYGLPRFSEELDFILRHPSSSFSWQPYLNKIAEDADDLGLAFQSVDRTKADAAIKKIFLKTDTIGNLLVFDMPFERDVRKQFKVKLEIDTNPPSGTAFETRFLTFPSAAAITSQTLECGFALKLHAILCRSYDKGRDFYDLIWYISRHIRPEMELMKNAMIQSGPWEGKRDLSFDLSWLGDQLRQRINRADWKLVRNDVERFIPLHEQASLNIWSNEFFLDQISQMQNYLG